MQRRGGPEEEMIRLAQQGKIETILGKKKSIDLDSLFPPLQRYVPLVVLPPPPNPSRVFLIEGAPGGGKSTLALHICHQWAQGASWLERFNLVILIYLRDQAIQNSNTLAEILPAHSSEMSKSVASQIQDADGKNVLFLFDGWDEFPPDLMNNSLVSTIIRQPHKFSLHQSTVLITSRPVSSGNLLHIADRRVEILGFTQHQIRDYIKKSLDGDSTRIHKLVQHLEEHPVIEGYCYVPLHAAILVHVFLTMKEALPTTLHELFCSLVLCCIVREQAKHEPNTSSPEFVSLDDLPDNLKSILNNLSILAYNGVTQDKVVFYSKDLQASHLPSSLPSLGLLQAVEGLTLCSTSLSYNFLHLSVQELLAAYNISHMVPSEQVKVFKELFKSSRFQAVLHYYCGFTKLANLEIQSFISSFQTRKSSLEDLLPLLHCFFEAQQPSLCQLVDHRFIPNEQQKFNSKYLSPVDFLAIGYFITSLLSTSTANTPTIHLVVDGIDDHRLKMLLNELSKYPVGRIPTSAGALSLELCKPYITRTGISHIASCLKKSLTISELKLFDGNIHSDDDVLLPIAEAMQTNTSLAKLSLPCMNLHDTKQNGSALTKMLQVNKSLTHLDLSMNKFSDSGACYIFEGLQQNATLLNLNLSNTINRATNPATTKSFTQMLLSNVSLAHLDLSLNSCILKSGASVFEGLKHNNTLVNLNLSETGIVATDRDTARSLTEILQENEKLAHLDLSKNTVSDSVARCIFEGLEHNTALVNLNLSKSGIKANDPATAMSLTKMLQENKKLAHLDLSKNTFSDLGARCIFKGLEQNTTLVSLNVSCTIADPDTAWSLTTMLKKNYCLTHLDLSNSSCSHQSIFEGLEHNTGLRHLNLQGVSDITDTDAEHIARALKFNNSLQVLNILDCLFLDHNGVDLILESLMFNSTLQTLYAMCIYTQSETLSDFKRKRAAQKLPSIDIILSHAYACRNSDEFDSD